MRTVDSDVYISSHFFLSAETEKTTLWNTKSVLANGEADLHRNRQGAHIMLMNEGRFVI